MSAYGTNQNGSGGGGGDYDEPPRHTEFLDLTNGEGGDKRSYDEEDEGHAPGAGPRSVSSPSSSSSNHNVANRVDPSTPGKVVEAGMEHTGRWTREEHEAFLSALQMYGKEWKKVAAKVKTRTVVQTRTHAQKYFQKLQKAVVDKGHSGHVDMGTDTKKPNNRKNRKPLPTLPTNSKTQRSQSTTSTAHLMAQLSTTISAAQNNFPPAPPFATPHGFSSAAPELPPQGASASASSSPHFSHEWGTKIVAPDPNEAMRRGFPEPSPAASGKRKMAELAAAQMLAGVAASERKATPPTPPPPAAAAAVAPCEMPRAPILGSGALQIVNPESLGITYAESKRRRHGEPSPTTPWDGQLEALISEDKKKEIVESGNRSDDGDEFQAPSPYPHPACGPGSIYNRSPLHKAVCDMDIMSISKELSDSIGAAGMHRKDEGGFFPIHSACALALRDIGDPSVVRVPLEIVKLLLSSGSDSNAMDGNRNTPLHWAARAGDAEVTHLLLMKNSPPDAQNDDGDTALHWAMKAGRRGMAVVRVLLENGARPSIFNNSFRRPLDVAGERFEEKTSEGEKRKLSKAGRAEFKRKKQDLLVEKRETRCNLLALSAQSRTLVLHHSECLEHIPKSESDWEVPDRVTTIMSRITPQVDAPDNTSVFPYEVTISSEFERARIELLSRVHSSDYLSFVSELSKELTQKAKDEEAGDSRPPQVVPFTPMVQKKILTLEGPAIKEGSHSDTSFSAGSLRAARRAAGAVQHAVDCVLVGRHRNAFCVVRPPGHHAGVKGLLAGGESCGFCIFNNVAAGALHAISDERLMCKRCAIVDIDVHHGNGTEEIVKRCHDPTKLFFFSIHLYDSDKKRQGYSFYPGTGDEDDLAYNIINVPISPMWREPHAASGRNSPLPVNTHNTRHKAKRDTNSSSAQSGDESSEVGGSDSLFKSSDTEGESPVFKSPPPKPAKGRENGQFGRNAYRNAIQNRLLPALRAFNPDLILISAGFDAAKGDVGNARHYAGGKERIGLDLEPDDYAWTTRKIVEIADICCQGRVVSVLEGGYGRTPTNPAERSAHASLDKSFFSECAVRHLHALIDPYDAEHRFG